ncbi:PilW family protein [Leeia sp. TBRC 13508]|uniref:PilW family protein n=1 Tax=Leeia speluncae TaxID=2884804 RepID=A0ABS8D5U4_9NEIS|nr:PilW family protein [Leeia speluncae]MCB6183559.1 PilW family protein [Leeia speluncae]
MLVKSIYKVSKSRGYTIVEMMVAAAVASIVALAVGSIYLSSNNTRRVQEMQNRMSEDGRYAMFMLNKIIAQAGFRPAPSSNAYTDLGNQMRITPDGTDPDKKATIRFQNDNTNVIGCNGQVISGSGTTQALSISWSGTIGDPLVCNNGSNMSWIGDSTGGVDTSVQVADFLLTYGLDTTKTNTNVTYVCDIGANTGTGDCIADSYNSSPSGSYEIVSVRACLVLRSSQVSTEVAKAADYNDCSGNPINNSQTDGRLYRTFSTTVVMRNR